jgi:hypothetical protein
MDAGVPPPMGETDHAFDKNNHVEASSNRGFTGDARGRSIAQDWRVFLARCRFGPRSAAREEPPAAGDDRVGDVLM